MFNNLENKLKVFGWIEFVGAFILVILYGISECTVQVGYSDTEFKFGMFLGYLAGGFVGSWLVAIPYFVFAKLLEDTQAIRANMGSGAGISKYAKVTVAEESVAPVAETSVNKRVVQRTSEPGAKTIAKVEYVRNALEYRLDEGLIFYAQKNYSKLSDDDKNELADIVTFIENNDADGLRAKLKEHA